MPSLKVNPDGSPHIHQYVRATKPDGSKDPRKYRCNHPDCTSFDFKNNLIGKRALCAVCGQREVILTVGMLRLSKPACTFCAQNKKAKAIKQKIHMLDDLFGEMGGAPQL